MRLNDVLSATRYPEALRAVDLLALRDHGWLAHRASALDLGVDASKGDAHHRDADTRGINQWRDCVGGCDLLLTVRSVVGAVLYLLAVSLGSRSRLSSSGGAARVRG